MKKGDKVKIIECDCTLWPREHNGEIGEFREKTKSGNYSIKLKYYWCLASKVGLIPE